MQYHLPWQHKLLRDRAMPASFHVRRPLAIATNIKLTIKTVLSVAFNAIMCHWNLLYSGIPKINKLKPQSVSPTWPLKIVIVPLQDNLSYGDTRLPRQSPISLKTHADLSYPPVGLDSACGGAHSQSSFSSEFIRDLIPQLFVRLFVRICNPTPECLQSGKFCVQCSNG